MTSARASCGPVGYRRFFTAPVLAMLLVVAALSMLLLPYMKNKWLSYLSSYCGCVGMDKMPSCHNTRPRIMPPGMQHGNMVDWVHCPSDNHHKVLLHHHEWNCGIPLKRTEEFDPLRCRGIAWHRSILLLPKSFIRKWCWWIVYVLRIRISCQSKQPPKALVPIWIPFNRILANENLKI